jgi:hypothetical protein
MVTPYARIIFVLDKKINLYASKLNFFGKKEYPLTSNILSSVIEDINSNRKGRITAMVNRIKTI